MATDLYGQHQFSQACLFRLLLGQELGAGRLLGGLIFFPAQFSGDLLGQPTCGTGLQQVINGSHDDLVPW